MVAEEHVSCFRFQISIISLTKLTEQEIPLLHKYPFRFLYTFLLQKYFRHHTSYTAAAGLFNRWDGNGQ